MVLPVPRLGWLGIPESDGGNFPPYARPPLLTWSLFNLDNYDEFTAQFQPEDVTLNVGTQYAEAWTLNRSNPVTQWVRGVTQTWNFNARLYATDAVHNIKSKIDTLLKTIEREESIQRPPIFLWTWGSFQVQCVVESVGDVKFELRPDGTPRSATFSIRLRRYTPHDIKVTDPNSPFADTFYYVVKNGQTYESMAELRYREPLWGEFLRRENPEHPYPQPGQIVAMPEPVRLLEFEVEPESPPLKRTEEGLQARKELFALRGGSKVSHVL